MVSHPVASWCLTSVECNLYAQGLISLSIDSPVAQPHPVRGVIWNSDENKQRHTKKEFLLPRLVQNVTQEIKRIFAWLNPPCKNVVNLRTVGEIFSKRFFCSFLFSRSIFFFWSKKSTGHSHISPAAIHLHTLAVVKPLN